MGLTPDDLRELLGIFEDSSWQEMTVTVGEDSLHISRRTVAETGAAPRSSAAALSTAPAVDGTTGGSAHDRQLSQATSATSGTASAERPPGTPVPAPSVGLFWRAPSPGAPPFVEVGTRIAPGDVIGIVEVMKLMNQVASTVGGVVSAVLVENGSMVEHGQPLVLVDPAA